MAGEKDNSNATLWILGVAAGVGAIASAWLAYRNYTMYEDLKKIITANPGLIWPTAVDKTRYVS